MLSRPTLSHVSADKCIKHILFSFRHATDDDIGRLRSQKMDGLDNLLLRLPVCSSKNLNFVLSRPRLILPRTIVRVQKYSYSIAHQEDDNIGYHQVQPRTAYTREYQDSRTVWSMKIRYNLCSLFIGHCSVNGETLNFIKVKDLERTCKCMVCCRECWHLTFRRIAVMEGNSEKMRIFLFLVCKPGVKGSTSSKTALPSTNVTSETSS